MKIGTYYRLPDGRKGMYVGINRDGMNAFSAHDDHGFLCHHYSHPEQDYAEYREPRVFEDEVVVFEWDDKQVVDLGSRMDDGECYKILARRKVTLEE